MLLVIVIASSDILMRGVNAKNSTAHTIIMNVDPTTPPMGELPTEVFFDFELEDIEGIIENKMHVAVKFLEYTSWVDKRLAYDKSTSVSSYIRNSKMDISYYRNNVWKPAMAYTEANKIDN